MDSDLMGGAGAAGGENVVEIWTDGGCKHDGHAIDCKSHAAFFRAERVGKNGLLAGRQTSAAEPLHDSE